MMGEISARLADVTIVTSDNPRGEEPAAIIAEIEKGMTGRAARTDLLVLAEAGARGYTVEEDREHAIAGALAIAAEDDVVVVAGKGHEDYQEVAGQRRHFDDREVVGQLLASN